MLLQIDGDSHLLSVTCCVPNTNATHSLLDEPSTNLVLVRQDEIIIHKFRIGCARLTRDHLFRGESPPSCSTCQSELIVEHLLLHSLVGAHRHNFESLCCVVVFNGDFICCVFVYQIVLVCRGYDLKD